MERISPLLVPAILRIIVQKKRLPASVCGNALCVSRFFVCVINFFQQKTDAARKLLAHQPNPPAPTRDRKYTRSANSVARNRVDPFTERFKKRRLHETPSQNEAASPPRPSLNGGAGETLLRKQVFTAVAKTSWNDQKAKRLIAERNRRSQSPSFCRNIARGRGGVIFVLAKSCTGCTGKNLRCGNGENKLCGLGCLKKKLFQRTSRTFENVRLRGVARFEDETKRENLWTRPAGVCFYGVFFAKF